MKNGNHPQGADWASVTAELKEREEEILRVNRQRFGTALLRIDYDAVRAHAEAMSERDAETYNGLRPRANELGLRISQEMSSPWRMVLIDSAGAELSVQTSSIVVIDRRLRELEELVRNLNQTLRTAQQSSSADGSA